jgi:hypothetical protein
MIDVITLVTEAMGDRSLAFQEARTTSAEASYAIHRSAVILGISGASEGATGAEACGMPRRDATSANDVKVVAIISVRVACEAYCEPEFLE